MYLRSAGGVVKSLFGASLVIMYAARNTHISIRLILVILNLVFLLIKYHFLIKNQLAYLYFCIKEFLP